MIVRRRLRYEAWYAVHLTAYAGIALAWFHQIPTGNELVLERDRRRLLAGALPRDARAPRRLSARVPVVNAFRYRLRVAEVVRRRRRASSRCGSPAAASTASTRAAGPVLPLALPRPAAAGGRRIPSRSPRRPTAGRCGSRSRRSATHAPARRDRARHARRRRGAVRRVHRARARRARRCCWSPAGSASRRCARCSRRWAATSSSSTASLREDGRHLPRRARGARARARRRRAHRRRRPRHRRRARACSRPTHLRELVPDIAERDVYVCGPPAMTDAIAQNVRARRRARAATSTSSDSLSDRRRLPMRKTDATLLTVAALALPVANGVAAATAPPATTKKKVVDQEGGRLGRRRPTAGERAGDARPSRRRRRPWARRGP